MNLDKRAVLSALERAEDDGLSLSELAAELDANAAERKDLRKLLGNMLREGTIDRIARARYVISDGAEEPVAVGRISVHPAGYGFVELEDGEGEVFVPAKFRGSALDGDRVLLYTWAGYKGTEGRVEEVLSRGRAKLTGTLRRAGRTVYLEPDDPRIATDYGRVSLVEGVSGQIGESVVVEIIQYPTPVRPELTGRVLRVLGDPEDPRTEIEKIIECAEIPYEFPQEAVAQAQRTPQEVRPQDLADRIDLRDRPFVTIDPETARDFDDALCIEQGPHGGTRVWVAVADVSHYVKPTDALDREAAIRGVSTYLPDRVIPMLPFELSSGICSLNPEVDRCAMVVAIDFADDGEIVGTDFAAAVIRSHARLDYPGVAGALSGDFRGRREHYRQWATALEQLAALARVRRRRRMERGSLDLELPEAKVVMDEDDPRLVRDVVRAKGSEEIKQAYQLVEEFMITANEAVGRFFTERDLTTVWRIHAPPEEKRLHELATIMESFGIDVDVEDAASPRGMKRVLEQIGDRPAARALSFLVLRSLKQAVWDTVNVGHFGLASEDYLHFTSPIRRYPDLLVHRLLKYYLHKEGKASGGSAGLVPPPDEELQGLAAASSQHERRAMDAEREAVAMYRAYLMRDHVGEEFTGRVSGITNFGVFVEIDEPFVEGLIKTDDLGDDRFDFDPTHLTISGRNTGLTLQLGDTVLVELLNTSVVRRRVDFRLLSVQGKRADDGGGKRKGRGAAPAPKDRAKHERRTTGKQKDRERRDVRKGKTRSRREAERGAAPGRGKRPKRR